MSNLVGFHVKIGHFMSNLVGSHVKIGHFSSNLVTFEVVRNSEAKINNHD